MFSPGPWTIKEQLGAFTEISSNNKWVASVVIDLPNKPERCHENARLISQAPNMFELLKLLQQLNSSFQFYTINRDDVERIELVETFFEENEEKIKQITKYVESGC